MHRAEENQREQFKSGSVKQRLTVIVCYGEKHPHRKPTALGGKEQKGGGGR